jgi:hypothetical protein
MKSANYIYIYTFQKLRTSLVQKRRETENLLTLFMYLGELRDSARDYVGTRALIEK